VSRKWYPLLFKCALITEQYSEGEIYVAICLDHYMVAQGSFAEDAKDSLSMQMWIQDNYLIEGRPMNPSLLEIGPFPYDITKARYYGRFVEYFTIDLNKVELYSTNDETKHILYRPS